MPPKIHKSYQWVNSINGSIIKVLLHCHHHHPYHQSMPIACIQLTPSHHLSLSSIALGKLPRQHPVFTEHKFLLIVPKLACP